MKYVFLSVPIYFQCLLLYAQAPANAQLAAIRLYNPGESNLPTVVEVTVGSIATPGLIDWQNVHLEYNGKTIPFSIREGKAHWRAALTTPIVKPAPEDLIVFTIPSLSKKWMQINVINGVAKTQSVIKGKGRLISVFYPNMKVLINEQTGMLTNVVAFGDSLLSAPMQLNFFEIDTGLVELHGNMNPGNSPASLSLLTKKPSNTSSVKLVSSSSNSALTELNFVLTNEDSVSIGLTYRIFPNNQIEIISDERPWSGSSPWLDHAVKNELLIIGEKKQLAGFETHFPYYGFKDYASSVRSTGILHKGIKSKIFELGEESINGRFWKRKLAFSPIRTIEKDQTILDILDEGLIVKTLPYHSKRLAANTQVTFSNEIAELGKMLVDELAKKGIGVKNESKDEKAMPNAISLNLTGNDSTSGIRGDGYRIESSENKIEISAFTKFGIFRALDACIQSLNTSPLSKRIPLISSNPVVDLRGGGFGGGKFEVDFPYGDEKEWKKSLDGLMKSGMNSVTDLGMWSNWKMPVTFKYMPELKSNNPEAYDEVSGAKFSYFDSSRVFATKLINYLHDRGVKVWLWIPVGAVPTTFEEKFADATVPGKTKVPRFMHPTYRRYLESYFKELLETYPIDGFVMVRDDNGGIDDTEEFKQFLEKSKTKDRVWEQYIMLSQLIRGMKFKGTIAVYPYFDLYKPSLQDLIAEDLLIVGHGSGLGVLTRKYETLGTMGDTWLDNLFAGFRIPTTPRMKRLLSDRGSYWIGGAYNGAELSWEAIGYFGWEPSASVNTFRYTFGARTFGEDAAIDYVSFSDVSDNLWEIMNMWLFPPRWFSLSDNKRKDIHSEALIYLKSYDEKLERLKKDYKGTEQTRWFAQAKLYSTYFRYHLERAVLSKSMEHLAVSNLDYSKKGQPIPDELRKQMVQLNDKIFSLADYYDKQVQLTPGAMLADMHDHKLNTPFREFVYGYHGYKVSLDQLLNVKQFDGEMKIAATKVSPGQPFEIKVELRNTGFMPWIKDAENVIRITGNVNKLGLKAETEFIRNAVVFGDRINVILKGVAPTGQGSEQIKIAFSSPYFAGNATIGGQILDIKW